jgi:hypothetical protein
MDRLTAAYLLRWLFIVGCLVPYWWAVGDQVVFARQGPDRKHMNWLGPAVLTLPWSLAGLPFDPDRGDGRTWLTVITTGGAFLNGLAFTLIVRRITRGPRRTPSY